jgi:hypothetical protein
MNHLTYEILAASAEGLNAALIFVGRFNKINSMLHCKDVYKAIKSEKD